MEHGGDIYRKQIKYDFSVNMNPCVKADLWEAIMKASIDSIGTYPDYKQREFRDSIARLEKVKPEEVIGVNGASEAFMVLSQVIKPKKVMLIEPSFSGYRHALKILDDCSIVTYSLLREKGFLIDDDFIKALEHEGAGGLDLLILANPNNPTGKAVDAEIMDRIISVCKKYDIKLIVDQCFLRMSQKGESLGDRINDYEGLYIVDAFTKLFSIPGVRLGYIISAVENIDKLKAYLPEWNLSSIAQKAGLICVDYLINRSFEERTINEINEERAYLIKELREAELEVFDSDTSFLLAYTRDFKLHEYLLENQILIRDCSNFEGLEKGFYRFAVKSHKENEALIGLLKKRVN